MGFIAYLVVTLLAVIPFWMILPRAGMASAWALVAVLPFGVLILLWILAFRRWPGEDVAARF